MMKVPEVQAAMERTGVERKCYTTDEVATMLPCINTVSGASMLQCFSSGIIRNAPIILSQLNTQTSCTKKTS